MALPETLDKTFADMLAAAEIEFRLEWQQQRSATGGGETRYADRGPARWLLTITTIAMEHAASRAIMAILNSRAGGLRSMLLYDPALPFPATDPTGEVFGLATPEVEGITDRLHLSLSGFPALYELPAGTYIEITFDGTRKYLGQLAESRTADTEGNVATVEIAPAMPAAVEAGDPVTVAKASARFRIVPNSARPTAVGGEHSRITFSAEQTYAYS